MSKEVETQERKRGHHREAGPKQSRKNNTAETHKACSAKANKQPRNNPKNTPTAEAEKQKTQSEKHNNEASKTREQSKKQQQKSESLKNLQKWPQFPNAESLNPIILAQETPLC